VGKGTVWVPAAHGERTVDLPDPERVEPCGAFMELILVLIL
jgi:hypothetical protein